MSLPEQALLSLTDIPEDQETTLPKLRTSPPRSPISSSRTRQPSHTKTPSQSSQSTQLSESDTGEKIRCINEEETTMDKFNLEFAKLPKEYKPFKHLFIPSGKRKPFPEEFKMKIPLIPGATPPKPAKGYSLSPLDQRILDKFIDNGLKDGIIQLSKSPYAASIFLVPKPGTDKKRPVIDYRLLNAITIKNSSPLPNSQRIIDFLGSSKVFSKFNLRQGYWQIPVDPEDREKTAFIVPHQGLFKFLVMPFRLCNAPAIFMEFMRKVLGKLLKAEEAVAYLDDVLSHAENLIKNQTINIKILTRFNLWNLKLTWEKCAIKVDRINFLGYTFTHDQQIPQDSKITVIQHWPKPHNLKTLQSFLGFLNYY